MGICGRQRRRGVTVDHVVASIDGALRACGDAMRWSPDPGQAAEPEPPCGIEISGDHGAPEFTNCVARPPVIGAS